MFNMGFTELIVLAIIALIVIGPKQLPEVARVVGRLLNEFKRATGDLTSSIAHVKSQAKDYVTSTEQQVKKTLNVDELKISKKSIQEDFEKYTSKILDTSDGHEAPQGGEQLDHGPGHDEDGFGEPHYEEDHEHLHDGEHDHLHSEESNEQDENEGDVPDEGIASKNHSEKSSKDPT